MVPMTASAQRLMEEMRAERAALRVNIVMTALTAAGLLAGVIAGATGAARPLVLGLYALAYAAGGLPASWQALKSLARRRLDIDLLMVLAALAAAAVGEVRDGAILLLLFSLAGTLEDYAMGNTKRAVVSLMKLRPDTANRMAEDGNLEAVPVTELRVGERVMVRPGERIPVDGAVLQGASAVDQSPITGESVPVDKVAGEGVFAGTVNGHGALEVEVTKEASQSTLARMIELTTEAQAQRSPSERFSEWFGERYTIFVLLGSAAALGVFLLMGIPRTEAFYKAATLLVVASPCSIVISVPAAVLSALAAAARMGVLFKGGAALEDFGNTELIAFDKTGTLTEGKMRVTDVFGVTRSEAEVLSIAAAVEQTSEHPVARSILRRAEEAGARARPVRDSRAVPGKGIVVTIEGERYWAGNRKMAAELGASLSAEAEDALEGLERQGKTAVLVGNDAVLGVLGVADTARASAADALRSLRAAGLKGVAMLTGDNSAVASSVAQQLGIDPAGVHADLLPEDKVERVRELNERGRVTFVGDGVNDAAALATASVGVAMGTAGSDVALEVADVALLSDDLGRLPQAYELARKANRVIRQNLTFALGIMLLMVVITVFFYLPLPLGVLGHEGGTILVVANGLRLLAYRPRDAHAAAAGSRAQGRELVPEG